jgi:hypothetical protein
MKKLFLALATVFILVSLLGIINAEQQNLGNFKRDTCVMLIQTCSNCTFVNLTSLISPTSDTILSNVEMTKDGTNYNYSFCNNSQIGEYIYNTIGDPDGSIITQPVGYTISGIGQNLSTSKALSYGLIFFFAFLIFVGLLVLGIFLPYNNSSDAMTGYVIATSNLKYLKLVFLGLAFIMSTFLSYFIWMIGYSYLDMDFFSNIMRFIFNIHIALMLPLFILFVYLTISNLVRDSKISEMLTRGFKVRE